jgi:hypothetical protein
LRETVPRIDGLFFGPLLISCAEEIRRRKIRLACKDEISSKEIYSCQGTILPKLTYKNVLIALTRKLSR